MKQGTEGQRIWDTERKIKTLVLDVLYLKFLRKKSSRDVKQTTGYLDFELNIKGKSWKLKFLSLQYTGGI